jgi:cytochrome c6
MPSRRTPVLLALLGISALVPVPLALAGGHGKAATKKIVNVKATDKGFTVVPKTAPAGAVTFVVKNNGKLAHGFKISTRKTATLKPGKTARLIVTFKKAGPVAYSSTLKADKAKGFKGTFRVTAAPKPAGPGNAAAGKSVFVANCGTCHTLTKAGTHGTIGPSLDGKKLAHAAIVKIVKTGKSGPAGAMPPFGGTLTATQIDDVAAFVVASNS